MSFTTQEEVFLAGSHSPGEVRSAKGWPELPSDMPGHIKQHCLERRAKSLGSKFTEFRSRTSKAVDDLVQRIQAAKLY